MLWGISIAVMVSFAGLIYVTYPDKPAMPRTFPNGLEKELGGPKAVRVSFQFIFASPIIF